MNGKWSLNEKFAPNTKRTGKHVGIVITIIVAIVAIACALFVWMNVRGSERSVDTAQTLEEAKRQLERAVL